MQPVMASETGMNGVIAKGLLKRSQLDTRKQRQAERIALRRHLLLCQCFHFESLVLVVLIIERVNAFSHAKMPNASKF